MDFAFTTARPRESGSKSRRSSPLRVLVVDEDPTTRKLLSRQVQEAGHLVEVVTDGRSAIQSLPTVDVAIVDSSLSHGAACVEFAHSHCEGLTVMYGVEELESEAARWASRLHATPLPKPYDLSTVLGKLADTRRRHNAARPSAASPASQQLAHHMARVAGLDSTVLVTGESGVGKTTLARQIHENSSRAHAPFVAVNCASLPRELIESELFGHKKGAFTGAVSDRTGRAEAADGGTLFLDEIGDLPLELQPKLLTFLQDHTLQRIGSNQNKAVDVRVIVATHRDLGQMCRDGMFRQDLYYRLNVIGLYVPSLRERAGEIPELVDDCLRKIAERRGDVAIEVDEQALAKMIMHDWPGNIRELENVLERASAFCDGRQILIKDLQFEQSLGRPRTRAAPQAAESNDTPMRQLAGMTLAEIERQAIIETLHYCDGNKAKSARTLGISEKSIYNKIRRLQITEEDLRIVQNG